MTARRGGAERREKPMTKPRRGRAPMVVLALVTRGVARSGDLGLSDGGYEPLHEDNFGEKIADLPWPVYRKVRTPTRRGAR